MRYVTLLVVLTLCACSGAPHHELTQTEKSDPIWQLNPDKWKYQENALISPPPNPGANETAPKQVYGQ